MELRGHTPRDRSLGFKEVRRFSLYLDHRHIWKGTHANNFFFFFLLFSGCVRGDGRLEVVLWVKNQLKRLESGLEDWNLV